MEYPRIDAPRLRTIAAWVLASLGLLLIVLTLLLTFGWGLLRHPIERRLAGSLGRPVTIGAIRRLDWFSLRPLLAIERVRVAQPAWAGPGDMLRARAVEVRIALPPLLLGKVRPQLTKIDGLRLALARDAAGRVNWRDGAEQPSGAPPLQLGSVAISDGVIGFDDARRDRHFVARVAVGAAGLTLAGHGRIDGHPATLRFVGPPVGQQRAWPFRAEVRSAIVALRIAGRMATPLDFGHFTARVEGSGRDLRDLDRLIEAGLPASQPFRLAATVRHDRPAWTVSGLDGTLGRSTIAGDIAVHKEGDRTLIDGALRSTAFDFDDLATDDGLARAAARARITGLRLFPETPIRLDKLRRTDGTLRIAIARLLWKRPSPLHTLTTTLTLDHGVLTAAPLVAGLERGRVTGSAIVRHQSGSPLLVLDLRLRGSRLEGLITDPAAASGPLEGRFRLQGHGDTLRAAMGHADGGFALVTRGGAIGRRTALLLGADVGRGVFANKTDQTALTCLIARFDTHGGIARPAPLVLDTPVARADGSGILNLADERFALALAGKPKARTLLRLNGPIQVLGTLRAPIVTPPPQIKSAGGVLKMVGKALGGTPEPLGADADCAGLAAQALR